MKEEELLVERTLKEELFDILKKEECLWRQKYRETWLREGDTNTKYFHRMTIANRSRNKIIEIKREDGMITQSMEEVNKEDFNFFDVILNKEV